MRKPSPTPVPTGGSGPILIITAVDRDSSLTTQGETGTVATVPTSDGKLVPGYLVASLSSRLRRVRGHERTFVVTVIGRQRQSFQN